MHQHDTRAEDLRTAAHIINNLGLHTGENFATKAGPLDIAAAIYRATTPGERFPQAMYYDEPRARDLIEANDRAMAAIRALSDSLDTLPGIDSDTGRPDYIDHVSHWAATRGIGEDAPPTVSEVIDRLRNTASGLDLRGYLSSVAAQYPTSHAA